MPLDLVQSATEIFKRYSDGEGHFGGVSAFGLIPAIPCLHVMFCYVHELHAKKCHTGADLFQRKLRMSNFTKLLCANCPHREVHWSNATC